MGRGAGIRPAYTNIIMVAESTLLLLPGGRPGGLPRGRSVPQVAPARNGGGAAIFRRPGELFATLSKMSDAGALQREAK